MNPNESALPLNQTINRSIKDYIKSICFPNPIINLMPWSNYLMEPHPTRSNLIISVDASCLEKLSSASVWQSVFFSNQFFFTLFQTQNRNPNRLLLLSQSNPNRAKCFYFFFTLPSSNSKNQTWKIVHQLEWSTSVHPFNLTEPVHWYDQQITLNLWISISISISIWLRNQWIILNEPEWTLL